MWSVKVASSEIIHKNPELNKKSHPEIAMVTKLHKTQQPQHNV